jgi:hypothetical protein
VKALRLYGIAAVNGESRPLVGDTELVIYRDLGAIVGKAAYSRIEADDEEILAQHKVVEQVFAHHAVLPAPVGVVFRGEESLKQWLELHYAALADGLTFVDGRCVARLHVTEDEKSDEDVDLKAVGAEMFRELRRESSATIPLKRTDDDEDRLSAAFLVERPRWEAFATAVGEAALKHPGIRWQITGPWPAYDFVQLKFGR